MDNRYTGFMKIKRECEKKPLNTEFDMIFSFKVEEIEENKVKISSINPYQVRKLMKKNSEFYVYVFDDENLSVKKAVTLENEGDHLIAEFLESSSSQEKRRFYRFHFCCEDLGFFRVKKGDKLLTEEGCIYEISESGIGIHLIFAGENIEKGDILEVSSPQEELFFKVEVVHISVEDIYNLIGGRVIDTNTNLINYIIRQYIKVSERIIFEG